LESLYSNIRILLYGVSFSDPELERKRFSLLEMGEEDIFTILREFLEIWRHEEFQNYFNKGLGSSSEISSR